MAGALFGIGRLIAAAWFRDQEKANNILHLLAKYAVIARQLCRAGNADVGRLLDLVVVHPPLGHRCGIMQIVLGHR